MSTQTDPTGDPSGAAGGQPSEAELRAAYEAELSRVTSADMVLQAAASLLNIGAFRLGLTGGGAGAPGADAPGQQDLEQVRDAIDAVRGLLPVIERRAPADLRPLRDALSQLQMAYTHAVSAAGSAAGAGASGEQAAPAAPAATQAPPGAAPPAGTQPAAPGPAEPQQQPDPDGPGPAVASGRLWVPGR